MQIEIFDQDVSTNLCEDLAKDDQSIALCKSLGLVGQQKLQNANNATRFPYKRMTQLEVAVYQQLFEAREYAEKFDGELIPVKVLEAFSKAKEAGICKRFYVWHSKYNDDPVLVGETGTPNPQTWDANYLNHEAFWLIARWGDALLPFQEMLELAKKNFMESETLRLEETISDAQEKLKNLAITCRRRFMV